MTNTVIIIFLSTIYSYGQFQSNSIGVVYLNSETADVYQLNVVLPIQALEKSDLNSYWANQTNKNIDFSGEILFFDRSGELLKIVLKANFKVDFWCENDGGMQYRPTFETTIDKGKFKRKLKAINKIQNIACFVLINKITMKPEQPDYKVSKDIVLEGDYNGDGIIDCFLWTYYDDAENCSGQPVNHLGINLQKGGKSFALRCCGP